MSVAFTVGLKVPVLVGVPEITPVVDRDRPAGKAPATRDHEYGGTPPVAVREVEYANPTLAAGSVFVTILSGFRTDRTRVLVDDWTGFEESRTENVRLNVPAVVGVPVIAPLGDSERPPGSVPPDSDHE